MVCRLDTAPTYTLSMLQRMEGRAAGGLGKPIWVNEPSRLLLAAKHHQWIGLGDDCFP